MAMTRTSQGRFASRFASRVVVGLTQGLLCLAAWAGATDHVPQTAVQVSPVVFHFVTVGDSREEPSNPTLSPQERLWVQNTKVLSRMVREWQVSHPQAVFFNGDMIYGYSTKRSELDPQYAYWRGVVAHLLETGTYVVPIPGNHEVQVKTAGEAGREGRRATVESEQAWRANMGDLAFDPMRWRAITGTVASAYDPANRPAPGTDGITSDQSALSYSFDVADMHFVVINTDPVGFDASAPASWLARDLEAARGRGARHFFVFGHKMAFTYVPPALKGSAADRASGFDVRPTVRDAFWDLIERFGATYFAGHEHVYDASQPRLTAGGSAWQFIVGSGGSPFSVGHQHAQRASDRMYAWADVEIHADASVDIRILGFDEHHGPTRLIDHMHLRH